MMEIRGALELRRIQTRGNSFGIVISRREMRLLGWLVGDHVVVEMKADVLVIRNLKSAAVQKRLAPAPRRAYANRQNTEE